MSGGAIVREERKGAGPAVVALPNPNALLVFPAFVGCRLSDKRTAEQHYFYSLDGLVPCLPISTWWSGPMTESKVKRADLLSPAAIFHLTRCYRQQAPL